MSELSGSPHEGHLTREACEKFLAGTLGAEERFALVAHLLRGCRRCRVLLAPWAEAPFPREEEDFSRDVEQYEAPVARALAAVRAKSQELEMNRLLARLGVNLMVRSGREQTELLEVLTRIPAVSPPLVRWAWCEAMVAVAREWPGASFGPGLDLAEEAMRLSETLADGVYPPEARADLQAQARMEWANRLRVREELDGAERELGEAARLLSRGTGDPLAAARFCDLLGSLYRAKRRLPEALDSLALAARLYRRCDEPHLAARVLVKRGATLIVAERPEEAIRTLEGALLHIDAARKPLLVLRAVHNLLLALADAGRGEDAWRRLWQVRDLYKLGSALDRVKLLTLEARIAATQGRFARAERFFREAKAGYEREGIRYFAAVDSLYLAAVLLEQGRPAEVLSLVDESLQTFQALRIERESLAAVLLLREAVAQGEATAALAHEAARKLRYLEARAPLRQS